MKYCSITTVTHDVVKRFPVIVENAYDIIAKEGCVLSTLSPFYDKTEIMLINGDTLESNFCFLDGRNLSNKNKSVDIIFATTENHNKQIVFVELKLNSKNFYTLDKTSFREKATSSSKAIGNSIPISKKYYLIFNISKIEEAKRFLFRVNPRLDNDFVALTIPKLFSKFFS